MNAAAPAASRVGMYELIRMVVLPRWISLNLD
jgi:hypothetical protein